MVLESSLQSKIKALKMVAEFIPGIKILRRMPSENLFMCNTGLTRFGWTADTFRSLSDQEFSSTVFDDKGPDTFLVGKTNDGETPISRRSVFVKYNKVTESYNLVVYCLALAEECNQQLAFIQIISITWESDVSNKLCRTLGETAFMRENSSKLSRLSKRNKEVLSLMANAYTAKEIGDQLCIEANTVNSHKKRIKQLLDIQHNADILKYGLSFDLITM